MNLIKTILKWSICFVILSIFIIYLLDMLALITINQEFAVLRYSSKFLKDIMMGLETSPVLFAINIAFFIKYLRKLRNELEKRPRDPVEIEYWDHKSNLAISLSFAIGIGYTAYGMMRALYTTLHDLPGNLEQVDALELLNGLVEGGIILALATTIAGMIIGYSMRFIKYDTVGRDLIKYSTEVSIRTVNNFEKQFTDIYKTLLRIEQGMRQ
ncbi:hypothetical protein ACFL03_08835 [Thermodesulfobacteriota bacterium]